jgi:ATP-dependent exoDNAse (exonuclease V) beta subunit
VTGGRSKPSGPNPDGRINAFLAHVIDWVRERKWNTIDEAADVLSAPAVRVEAVSAPPLPLADFVRSRQSKVNVDVPMLSFSSISQFEQCPRSVTYRLAYGLPGLGRDNRAAVVGEDGPGVGSSRSRDSLLSAGAYGNLVHRALETWGRTPGKPAAEYVTVAVRDLGLKPSKTERAGAVASVEAVIATLSGWKPLLVEAPFTLDIGDVQVNGFIDLVAADPAGRNVIIDYKTGITEKEHYALQLALYRIAAAKAYRIDVSASAIARLDANGVRFEFVEMPDEAAVRTHVEDVAAGIRTGDLTAKAGPQCATCPFRAAPCLDFAPTAPVQLALG